MGITRKLGAVALAALAVAEIAIVIIIVAAITVALRSSTTRYSAMQTKMAATDWYQLSTGIGDGSEDLDNAWAGYQVQGGPFNGVSATFNAPRPMSNQPSICKSGVTGTVSPKCDEAIWAGIGGATSNSNSIIQAGIAERPIVGTRAARLRAWYELYPAPSFNVNLSVHQGNRISVNIYKTVTPNLWMIRITNDTTGQTFSTLQSYTGSVSSAEWIVEAPGWDPLTLPALTPVTFTHSKYSEPRDEQGVYEPDIMSQHQIRTVISPVTPRDSFTVTSRLITTSSRKGKL